MPATASKHQYDVCVVGSGAGGAPVACALAQKGLRVAILERGKRYGPEDFRVDELTACRRDFFQPGLQEGIREIQYGDNPPVRANHLWTGTCCGGGTARMSGFFLPLQTDDFHPLSNFGAIPNATYSDWPIGLKDLLPYYDQVETDVGVSGDAKRMPPGRWAGPFPYPRLRDHPFGGLIDQACERLGLHAFPTPRAVLSRPWKNRKDCGYCGFCGSYGCGRSAKGSTLVTYLAKALSTGHAALHPNHYVTRLNAKADRIVSVSCIDESGAQKTITARVYVLACSAIETARLLLNSHSTDHPNGLANMSGQVGNNLAFQMNCEVNGFFPKGILPEGHLSISPFVQRTLQDFYSLDSAALAYPKGGTVIFLLPHPNPIQRALSLSRDPVTGKRFYGAPLKKRMKEYFSYDHLLSDVFMEFIPNRHTRVSVAKGLKDRWGVPAARVHYGPHPENMKARQVMARKIAAIYREMGGEKATYDPNPYTAGECQQGTCRFGPDPKISVLRPDCRAHDVKNLYVTDSSFMPSGIPVPPAFTIMANALRVADILYNNGA